MYFSLFSLIFFVALITFSANPSPKTFLAQINHLRDIQGRGGESLFFSQKTNLLEKPELSIVEENSIKAISPPQALSARVFGAFFGQDLPETPPIIREYIVEEGDSLWSIAEKFNLSVETLLWANDLSKNSKILPGQKLIILPLDGVIHHVKSGDTVSEIAKRYKGKIEEIIAFNELSDQADIYIGDILIIPGGKMPLSPPLSPTQIPLAHAYFIFPTQGKISQRLHWYNAVDIANNCGTPIYAAAGGRVLKVKMTSSRSKWAFGGKGNHLTILHPNGVVTYYGHILTSFVNPGEKVYQGQRIALMGGYPGSPGAGNSTGCHLHFGVRGAKNPLASYSLGSQIRYK